MKLVGNKVATPKVARKFKNGDRVRCITFPDMQGIVVGHKSGTLYVNGPLYWFALIKLTQLGTSGLGVYVPGEIAILFERAWELMP